MKRQALTITLKQLTNLKSELIEEAIKLNKELGIDRSVDYNKKILISIINKTGMSDDWEIE